MDDRRFDHLSRRLGMRLGRRGAIALAGGVAAAALAGDNALAARATCRPSGAGCTRNAQCCSTICATGRNVLRARRNRCVCPADTLACGSTCCPAGSACIDGACITACIPTVESNACLLTARSVVQADTCLVAQVDNALTCIDDTDCTTSDFDPSLLLEDIGCFVSFTTSDYSENSLSGFCISWSNGPNVCPP